MGNPDGCFFWDAYFVKNDMMMRKGGEGGGVGKFLRSCDLRHAHQKAIEIESCGKGRKRERERGGGVETRNPEKFEGEIFTRQNIVID